VALVSDEADGSLNGIFDMKTNNARPVIGFIGLGDQGLSMATAIPEAGYELHVWARRPGDLNALGNVSYVRHDTTRELAAACDIVGLCVSTDDDVMEIVADGLLAGLRPGSIIVNHGTGTPGNAVRLAHTCAPSQVAVLDAPVSGGRPSAEARTLTTMVGGPEAAAARCEPVFRAFSRHVVHMGNTGAGQSAKLFNNTLMMMNQANIAEIVELAVRFGTDPSKLVEVLKLGSAASSALTLLGTMVTRATVDHRAEVEALGHAAVRGGDGRARRRCNRGDSPRLGWGARFTGAAAPSRSLIRLDLT
jgi:3-hydroxyisobutyrate dehydrogenase-like beta-hydroxyacid dehydrogenase